MQTSTKIAVDCGHSNPSSTQVTGLGSVTTFVSERTILPLDFDLQPASIDASISALNNAACLDRVNRHINAYIQAAEKIKDASSRSGSILDSRFDDEIGRMRMQSRYLLVMGIWRRRSRYAVCRMDGDRKDGWMGGWVDGWMGGWVDGWMDGWSGSMAVENDAYLKTCTGRLGDLLLWLGFGVGSTTLTSFSAWIGHIEMMNGIRG